VPFGYRADGRLCIRFAPCHGHARIGLCTATPFDGLTLTRIPLPSSVYFVRVCTVLFLFSTYRRPSSVSKPRRSPMEPRWRRRRCVLPLVFVRALCSFGCCPLRLSVDVLTPPFFLVSQATTHRLGITALITMPFGYRADGRLCVRFALRHDRAPISSCKHSHPVWSSYVETIFLSSPPLPPPPPLANRHGRWEELL
jgi:hypothetical protein